MVRARFGKEFPDTEQYERRIEFIRVGDTVRTEGWLKGEPMLSKRPRSIFYPGYTMQDKDLMGHLLVG